jgi:hypothetical protein
MAIEKGLYQAPEGIEALAEQETPIEIEIENPDEVTIGLDGLEISLGPEEETADDFDANLAEYMSEASLAAMAGDLIGDFESDIASRKDWIQTYVDGLELLGLKIEERTEPWEGACGVYHPLLSEAVVKFQSETIMETFPASGPVKTQIIGKETPAKKDAADRVQADMNYQLTDVMQEYRPEHERLLWGLGIAGNAFKKVYYDPSLQRQVAMYVPAEDIVVPYGASSIESAERVSHVMRKTENDLRKLQAAGFYRDVDLGTPDNVLDEVEKKIAEKLGFRATSDDRYKVLEMHVELDLEGFEHEDEEGEQTGIALPYVVTVEKGSGSILAIRRNWNPDDETHKKRQHFVHYGYIPGFGFYCFGLIHLIGAFAKSGTSILRQLVDAGSLSNLPGGFKTRGLRVKGDDTPIAPGEFRDVDVPSGTMKDNIMPLPYKEPSMVLAGLLDKIVDEGRRFASAADLKVADMSGNTPVGTTLAILERTLKVMTAVQARIHYSMKQEFRLLKRIIADYTPEDYSYQPSEGTRFAKRSDYDDVDVIPVSDPNAATMSQKIMQYQAALQLAQSAPQLYNLPLLHRQMLDVLGIKDAKKLVPLPDDQKPKDPITENMKALKGEPVKAFIYQDHEAHIIVHMSMMQDPKIMKLIGQNPQAQMIMGALMAHIQEHLGFEYRRQMEEMIGVPIPYSDEEDYEMPEEVELQIARLAAPAAQKLLQQDQTAVAAQQAQQAAQDPLVQIQQAELQIKSQEVQIKQAQLQADTAAKAQQMAIEQERIASQERIANMQMSAKAQKDQVELQVQREIEGAKLASKERLEGSKLGVDVAKHTEQMSKQERSTKGR